MAKARAIRRTRVVNEVQGGNVDGGIRRSNIARGDLMNAESF
jgi:hypothetical protein